MKQALRAVAAAVDVDRLHARLDELARIGADPVGGVTRIAFSEEEREATDLVASWMSEAGLDVRFDAFGNMFGATDDHAPGVEVSMSGSHVDTVPNGGRFDGALGVVAAIEAVEAMRAARRPARPPLEVVVWRCEEPVRFSQGKAGSLVFSGGVAPEDLRPIEDPPFDLAAALAREGSRSHRDASRRVASYLELHIEQGSRLERAGARIGVVTAIAAPIRLRVRLGGSADHSGATPMDGRRDALCAAAELVLDVERAALAESERQSVATAVAIECRPGAMNVVPAEAVLLVDIRGIDLDSMERVVDGIRTAAASVGKRRDVDVEVCTLSRGEPTPLSEAVVATLVETVRLLGEEPLSLPSGAGHDAQCLAGIADVGVLFVPSVGGVSHAPAELTPAEDVAAGARALAACWWRLASGL